VGDGSILLLIVSAVRVQLVAEHVVDPDVTDHRPAKLRVLYQRRSHQQPAIAAAGDSEMPRRGPAGGDQRLRRRGEIVEDILFGSEPALAVPCFAELIATAEVRHGVNAASLEPGELGAYEVRC